MPPRALSVRLRGIVVYKPKAPTHSVVGRHPDTRDTDMLTVRDATGFLYRLYTRYTVIRELGAVKGI